MPAQTPPEERKSASGTRHAMRALSELSPIQKKIFFGIGATLAALVLLRFLMNDIIRAHEHGSAWEVGAEVGGSVAFLTIAIAFMVPPFGMWLISHLPLPKFLKRGNS